MNHDKKVLMCGRKKIIEQRNNIIASMFFIVFVILPIVLYIVFN